jgi:dTDP-glucose pyrophosphorylase
MTTPTLVLMAAGLGSRYGGLKQVERVGPGGEMILDYSIFDAIRAGFGRVVFIIRRDIEDDFKRAVGGRFERHVAVDYAFQELDDLPGGRQPRPERTKPWGTGQAVLLTEPLLAGPFAVINADDFYGSSAFRLLFDHLAATDVRSSDYSLVGYQLSQTLSDHGSVSRGVCELDAGRMLRRIREIKAIEPDAGAGRYRDETGAEHSLPGDTSVSMNMWGFTPTIFEHLRRQFMEFLDVHLSSEREEFLLPTAVGALIDSGAARVHVLPSAARWFGITYQEDKALVRNGIAALIAGGEYPERLWS